MMTHCESTVVRPVSSSRRLRTVTLGQVITLVTRTMLVLGCLARPVNGQSVLFKLLEADAQTPLAGVLVSELDAGGASGVPVLSTAGGIATLNLHGVNSVRLLVRRIGFTPMTVGPITVPRNPSGPIVVTITRFTPVTLSAIRVTTQPSCSANVGSPAAGARDAWAAVRTALEASRLTRSQRLVKTAAVTFERWIPLGGSPGRTDTTGRGMSGERPFVSPSESALERDGYFKRHDDGSASFYGPDEDVLLSDGFVRHHCIFVSSARRDSTPTLVALAFLPRDNDRVPDIRGFIWVDSVTSELKQIQFEYVRVPLPVATDSLGGSVEFAHLVSGGWIVSDWTLRIPHFATRAGDDFSQHQVLDAHVEVGGRATPIQDAVIPDRTLLRRISGVVYDSLTGRPVAGATVHLSDLDKDRTTDSIGHFEFDSLPAGTHSILIDYPTYDALGVSSLGARVDLTPALLTNVWFAVPAFETMWRQFCPHAPPQGPDARIVFGSMRADDGSGLRVDGATVTWRGIGEAAASRGQVQSDSSGAYAICGVINEARIVVSASSTEGASRDTTVHLSSVRIARLDLRLLPKAVLAALAADSARGVATSRYRLRVLTDRGEPIQYASVTVNGGAVRTSDQFGEVALGAQRPKPTSTIVRRIGFEPWSGSVVFADTNSVVTVSLKPSVETLGTVRVSAKRAAISPFVQGFYDRWEQAQKGALSGTFIGPEELEFRHPRKLGEMLQGLNGVRLICNEMAECSIQSTRPGSLEMGSGCPMAVVVDGKQIYGDLTIDRLVDVDDVMAIEVYPRGGNTPISLQYNDTKCGVVAFWTGSRR